MTCQKIFEILKFATEPRLKSKYECTSDKKYFGVLPKEPVLFPPEHVHAISSSLKRESFQALSECLSGDPPEETLFPFTSTVLQEEDSSEYKSCWTYMILIEVSDEVINQTFEALTAITKVKCFYRGGPRQVGG